MENELNIFADDAFSVFSMTEAINVIPNLYGKVSGMGLFIPEGVNTLSVGIEQQNGVISILPDVPRGGPATKNKTGKRTLKTVSIPHFPLDDVITAQSIQGIRGYRGEPRLATVQTVVNRKLIEMKRKHDITREWLLCGALKGIVYASDATTELANFYDLLGVTAKTVDFTLGTTTVEMKDKCAEVKDHIEANLLGDTMTGIKALCGRAWFNKFTSHKSVKDAYSLWDKSPNPFRNDVSKGFPFQEIDFEVYVGNAPDDAGNSRKFIADDEVRFFPMGTTDTFREYNAPADMIEFANTMGLPFYASQELLKHGKGVEIYTETDLLPVCRRPGVLVKGYTSN